MAKQTLCLEARAKINLRLEILGRRADGYHDIRSLVVPVSVHDRVLLELTDGAIETEIEQNGLAGSEIGLLPPSEQNLATRAARELKRVTGFPGGVYVSIAKNIPVGGGLGGGSADAAAVLRGLNTLWQTGLDRAALMAVGARIGCDVPAIVSGGAAQMEGLGERVVPIHSAMDDRGCGWWMVIVNPGFLVSTRDVYERCSSALTSPRIPFKSMVSAWEKGDVDMGGRSLFNGLQETVFAKYPLIEMVAEHVEKAGAAGTLLSGSGASVFGLARDAHDAHCIAERLGEELKTPAWVKVARTLPDGVMVAHGPLEA